MTRDDKATVAVPGKTATPDAQLSVNLGKLDAHLRQDAPVIDKGGPAVPGASATDADGQPRLTRPRRISGPTSSSTVLLWRQQAQRPRGSRPAPP